MILRATDILVSVGEEPVLTYFKQVFCHEQAKQRRNKPLI